MRVIIAWHWARLQIASRRLLPSFRETVVTLSVSFSIGRDSLLV